MPPPEQQPYYPVPQPLPPPPSGGFLKKGLVMPLVMIGIVMFFVGLMIVTSTAFIKPPSNYDDREGYNDSIRNMGGAGRLVIEIGGLMACIGLVCGGIAADDVSDKVRAVMVSAGVAMIIATLVVLGLFSGLGAF